jgi:cell fate (sporulation/competence/biofilm development) regulator YmcA (YheA/YmcA/DUF963 family)
MTQQFDEGVKEILLSLLSVGATMKGTDYMLDQIKKRPEPIEQKIQALDELEQNSSPAQAREVQQVKQEIKQSEESKPVLVRPNKTYPKEAPQAKVDKPTARKQYIYDRLRKGGITHIGAIGIIANLMAESTPNIEPSYVQLPTGPGRGIAQWEAGGRYDTDRINLVNFADKRGKDWTDLDTQIDFMLHELNTIDEYKRVKAQINAASSIDQAADIFLKKYEKAGKPNADKRQLYAKQLLNIIKP